MTIPGHGGPEAAVSLFSLEVIARIAAEGHPIGPGTTGENLTVEGLDWSLAVPGTLLGIGEVVLEVTSFTPPAGRSGDRFSMATRAAFTSGSTPVRAGYTHGSWRKAPSPPGT